MKQFSLKEYLRNPNQKVVTRNGEKVRIICTDRKIEHFPIVALCTSTITGQETCRSYGINGNYNAYDQSVLDLMFAPQKNEYWINVYKNKDNNNNPEEGKENAGNMDGTEEASKEETSDSEGVQ